MVFDSAGFFDIHPPLGKLILAFGGKLLGYKADDKFVIDKIGHVYPSHIHFILLRYVSSFFSICTVPLTYCISRLLKVSSMSSILSTTTVLFDYLGLIEGRLILMDSQLLFFSQLSLLFALLLWRSPPRAYGLSLVTGVMCGLALSIKHTALATPALIAVVSFFGLHFLQDSQPLNMSQCFVGVISGLIVYIIPFYIMFNLLWLSGGKYDKFMPLHFRRTLIGSSDYDELAARKSFIRLFLYLNRKMIASNAGIKKRHNWESYWYQWIVNWRGVLYYSLRNGSDKTRKSQIYLLGNPAISLLILTCVVSFLTLLCVRIRYRHSFRTTTTDDDIKWQWKIGNGVFCLWGWLCNLLPFILVDRAAFLYHYIPGMFYGQLLCGVLFDFLPRNVRAMASIAVMCVVAAAFAYWSPWVYALELTDAQHAQRRWYGRWN